VTNDGARIYTRPNNPFTLELKDSSIVDYLGNFVLFSSLGGPQTQIWGWFGCGVPSRC
jgi:hypothetical protein